MVKVRSALLTYVTCYITKHEKAYAVLWYGSFAAKHTIFWGRFAEKNIALFHRETRENVEQEEVARYI